MISDAHTWNLVFLQLLLEEAGHQVANLGPCVPDDFLVAECQWKQPDLIVVSSVNGHGFHDGMRVIARLRSCPELLTTPVVIGGKLAITGVDRGARSPALLAAGFDGVFEEGVPVDAFLAYVRSLSAGVLL
jgi:methylaspartate mutase sigma subunit